MLTTQQQLVAAEAKNTELAAKVADLEAKLAAVPNVEQAVNAAVAPIQAELATARTDLSASQAREGVLKTELEAAKADIDKKVSAKALEITAAQGNVPPMTFKPSGNPATAGKSREALWREYHALPLAERNTFYKANRAAMREQ